MIEAFTALLWPVIVPALVICLFAGFVNARMGK